MNDFVRVIALVSGLVGCTAPSARSPSSTRELDCRAIAEVTAKMLAGHVHYSRVDASLGSRVAESYLDLLDPERILFASSEVSSARAQVEQSIEQIESGNCAAIHVLEREVSNRLSALVALAGARRTSAAETGGSPAAVHIDTWLATYREIDAGNADRLVVDHYERIARRFAERDREDAYATYLSAFARALDQGSSYLAPKVVDDFRKSMDSDLAGIGLALSDHRGVIAVERIIPGGSVDIQGGVQVGDQIVAIGEGTGEPEYVTGSGLFEGVQRIRGRPGTEVTLRVLRPGSGGARGVTLTRRPSELDSERAELRFRRVDRDDRRFEIAILVLPSFYADARYQSPRDVLDLLREINENRANGVIIDVRENGGGSLDAAVEIAGLFIEAGPIGMAKDRKGRTRVLADPDPRIHCALPLIVLTSKSTAAAAEVFAGAMQDYRRALVVGEGRTFGRGTVQRIFPMRPGLGALKLTTDVLYAPGGRSLEGEGLDSDFRLRSADDAAPQEDRRFSLPDEAVTALAAESTSHRGFVAIEPGIVEELSRRHAQRAKGSPASEAAAMSAEILADYLAMFAR
jgi:carboxyl-terminal processing protease